jgi:hypothetical protein
LNRDFLLVVDDDVGVAAVLQELAQAELARDTVKKR